MDFYAQTGKMAIGSRLRRLSDMITGEAARLYALYNTDFQPRWFPVFYVLSKNSEKNITEIANEIGHSHVSVIQIVREMKKKGYITEKGDRNDKRKKAVALSATGKKISVKLQDQYHDVRIAIEGAMAETNHDLWQAIEEWEHLLDQKSLYRRVLEQKRTRESGLVSIVDYKPQYQKAFKALNEEWISTYFEMEETDHKALDHPKQYILNKGGYIFIALVNKEPVGTCALIRMNDTTFELAKMAVSPKAQGKGIGLLLGEAVIDKAKAMGAKTLYLESNTMLKPAITLYYKLGFKKVTGRPTPYKRSNIQMELELTK